MSLRLLTAVASAALLAACGGGSPETETETAATTPAADTPAASAGTVDTPESAPVDMAEATETVTDMVEDAVAEVVDGPDPSVILAALGDAYAAADLSNGQRQFRRCQSCHTLNEGGRHTVGPNLYGIMGAPAAAQERFSYSRQLTESGLVWDAATMDAWLENPRSMVPGNRMSFVGLRDADARRDVIAYLAVETAQ